MKTSGFGVLPILGFRLGFGTIPMGTTMLVREMKCIFTGATISMVLRTNTTTAIIQSVSNPRKYNRYLYFNQLNHTLTKHKTFLGPMSEPSVEMTDCLMWTLALVTWRISSPLETNLMLWNKI